MIWDLQSKALTLNQDAWWNSKSRLTIGSFGTEVSSASRRIIEKRRIKSWVKRLNIIELLSQIMKARNEYI